MQRTENVELTVLCLIHQNDKYLLQNRLKEDWKGLTLPGGHIEKNESIIDAVIREMKEETGLDIQNPRLCGIKQFLQVMEDDNLTEFQYVIENGKWNMIIK